MDLDALDPETRELLFWLQDKLYHDGIEGVHYMDAARLWAERNAADTVADEISKELKRL